MKRKITILLAALLIGTNTFAQDPELLDRFWYVIKINYFGDDIFPPAFDPQYGYHSLYMDYEGPGTGELFLESCHAGVAGLEFSGVPNEFNVELPLNVLQSDCFNSNYQTYENMYFGIYENNAADPFEYEITDEGNGALSMIVTAGNGNKIYYGNEILSAREFDLSSIVIYPNPVSDDLQISSTTPIEQLNVYSVSGQQLISKSGQINTIDVSSLSEGMYLLEITSEGKSQIQKFIKH